MKKFWKTVAFLGTAALAVTGGICLIRKFFNPDEELEDFDVLSHVKNFYRLMQSRFLPY